MSNPHPTYKFPKGVSGNPGGRKKGKTMKEYAREFMMLMTDEEKEDFMNSLESDVVWKMAEGQPHQTTDIEVEFKPIPLLDVLRNPSNKENSQLKEEN